LIQEAQAYADENGLLYMETSARTAANVEEIFRAIGKNHLELKGVANLVGEGWKGGMNSCLYLD